MTKTVKSLLLLSGIFFIATSACGKGILDRKDYRFLEQMTLDVLEAARIRPGDTPTDIHPQNNTGGTVICPGGHYPSFWIRDYAMSLDCGLIGVGEQEHMLRLTASTQCTQAWITGGGSMVPFGSIADHVRVDDGLPIYFPGTYDFRGQGTHAWGTLPPYGDQFFFVHMAHCFATGGGDLSIFSEDMDGFKLSERLEIAFNMVPCDLDNYLVTASDHFRGVDFGFRDVVTITGELAFPSILKYRAARQLSELFGMAGDGTKAGKYRDIAEKLKESIPATFSDERGMLRASTGKSAQADVWSTALAVYYGIIEGDAALRISRTLAAAYRDGALAYKGNIRHVLTTDDFSETTAWESAMAARNTYQNGAYWGTPTGWVCYAIAMTDLEAARRLAAEFVADLRENDYRKTGEPGAPWECFHYEGNRQNPVYLTTVSCPLEAFRRMMREEVGK